jgi:hypothetical protein
MNKSDPHSVNPTRRKLFKALLGGGALFAGAGALPERWVRPVIQTVIVPAHARLSGMYVMAAGNTQVTQISAPVTGQNETGTADRIAQALGESVPLAHGAPTTTLNLYVCVNPSADGSKADINVYIWSRGVDDCALAMAGGSITGVDVPSYGNEITNFGPICTLFTPETADTGGLLDRLGIVRSAHAIPTPNATVDILSVTNGAEGDVHLPITAPIVPSAITTNYHFDIDPGECSPPECCPAPI